MSNDDRVWWGVLLFLVLMGLALRAPGINWGRGLAGVHVPYVQIHPDEPRFVEIARGLHEGTVFRKSYVMGFSTPQRLALLSAKKSLSDEHLVRIARVVSLLSGLALIVVIYFFTARWTGSLPVALITSGLVTLNTWCVTQSVYGTADMTYTMLLYLFGGLVMRGFDRSSGLVLLGAAAVAGAAMSVKFGVILLPSLFLLGHGVRARRFLWGGAFIGVAILSFFGFQGFAFDLEVVRSIWTSFSRENVHGFEHSLWMNVPVYAMQIVRICGIPAVCLALLGLYSFRFTKVVARKGPLVAFLPLILHGVGLFCISLPFPRHLLPLIPFALMLAATGTWHCARARVLLIPLLCVWSMVLTLTDAKALWSDARGDTMRWIASHVAQNQSVWASPYVALPVDKFYPQGGASSADVVILHEAWYYRFLRSELNPISLPGTNQLYHAYPEELKWYHSFVASQGDDGPEDAFVSGPTHVLPEQIIYEKLWGSLNKFAGTCRIIVRKK